MTTRRVNGIIPIRGEEHNHAKHQFGYLQSAAIPTTAIGNSTFRGKVKRTWYRKLVECDIRRRLHFMVYQSQPEFCTTFDVAVVNLKL